MRALVFAAFAVALAFVPAPPASARTIHTVIEDDELALFSPGRLPAFIRTLKWLGVDELRVSAEWKIEAPDPDAGSPPPYFDPANPRSYDASLGMEALDRAVRAASAAGIGVIVDPAFSAPRWATSDPLPRIPTGATLYDDNINVRELATWEGMLAERYSGHYTPRGAARPLPRVGTFTLWNEPNQSGFLGPQYQGTEPVSADWERALIRAAYPAIKRASPEATVLIGNTSPTGASQQEGNLGVPPLTFIRRLACVNAALRPIDTGSCARFTTLPADGYSQHTYEYQAAPWVQSAQNEAEIGDLRRLQALLDRLVAMHRLAPRAAQVWITEQGYQSNGQLSNQPWSQAKQAQLNAEAEYVAWRDGQAVSFAQFLLRDTLTSETIALRHRTHDPNLTVGGTWTTGLEREDGSPKPALAMFRTPVVARFLSSAPSAGWFFSSPLGARAELAQVWGRARPMHTPTMIIVQTRTVGLGAWRSVSQTVTDGNGIFAVTVAANAGLPVAVRFLWLDGGGRWEASPATSVVRMSGLGHPHR
ncbi:MAG TPA: hypothetical protein VG223_09505 [Solirubrobacteraceae bacterium]|nr:hypothetical protein [Solirubrobacteraceae bacterium]